jgi:curli production assembly/transport component CsgG
LRFSISDKIFRYTSIFLSCVGVSTEYRTDRVSVALRLISTKTGEVLITTETSATIFSYQVSSNLFRFIEQNENLLEAETGMASNESPNIAVRRAVELAVINIVEEGFDRSLWAARKTSLTRERKDSQ